MTQDGEAPPRTTAGGGRYRIESLLGQGGMAAVHRVVDSATGRSLALKRLLRTPINPNINAEHSITLFEREYLTLAQLAHPQIVAAHDYGIDEDGPYYTMELLDGGDLQSLAPMPWVRASALAHDVCSALALLHSRRMVYRDLNPRNVRCTSDGRAKLMDFGAMTPMGVSRGLVGTLPFVAPEALHQQVLDARTDLYALGATLYFTLVQRHAYPARDVLELHDIWRSRPRRPAELVAGLPEALDRLVMELLQLDPSGRPASATEVMERLGAIAGMRASEQPLVSQAYLVNPTLVGRAAELSVVHELTPRALAGRGVSLLIEGAPGLGRTRFLAACVLSAKLAGALVLQADALAVQGAPFDVVRALARQLLQAVGALARQAAEPHLALLGRVIPELTVGRDHVLLDEGTAPEALYRRVQPALRQWLLKIAEQRPLLIAIDNLPDADEASVAFVSLLAQQVSGHGVMIAATGSREQRPSYLRSALDLFAGASTTLQLRPLTRDLTVELLRSVFGDVPNVDAVAADVHRVTAGNLRDLMHVAQHLVSQGSIRYSAGSWRLPAQMSASELPASMAEALRARVSTLSLPARSIAHGLSCEPGQRFSFDECAALLSDASSTATVLRALDELVEAEVVVSTGDRYALVHQGFAAALASFATAEQTAAVHLRLADVFAHRGAGFRVARHLLAGNERERGLSALLVEARASAQRTYVDPQAFFDLLRALPVDWLSTYELGLRCCAEQGRSAKDVDVLLARLFGLIGSSVPQANSYAQIQRRLDWLYREAGLDLFAAQPPTLDFATRLERALAGAAERYARTPEHDRVFEPKEAMEQLGRTVIAAVGAISSSLDHEAWRNLPSLLPLALLSPAIAVIEQLRQGIGARISGRVEAAIETYEALVERLSQPDRGGLEYSPHLTTVNRVQLSIGTLEAAIGRPRCLERAWETEREPAYAIPAQSLRHLYYVWQGDAAEAERYKRLIDVQQVESTGHSVFAEQNLLSELCAHGLADDMTRVRRATEAAETHAQVHRAWQPVYLYGCGEHSRIRGDYVSALAEFEAALLQVQAGAHQVWPNLAGAYLRTLLELQRYDEVKTIGTACLKQADARGLGYVRNYLRMPLSLALSKLGEHTDAVSLAQTAIDELLALGASGLNLAAAYDARARIDLDLGDSANAERHAALAVRDWRTARKRLSVVQESGPSTLREIYDREHDEGSLFSQFGAAIERCQNETERARCGVTFLVRASGALGGVLYLQKAGGLTYVASVGDTAASGELDARALSYLERELDAAEITQVYCEVSEPVRMEQATRAERRFVPVLLTHPAAGGIAVTGVAMLLTLETSAFSYPRRVAAELSRAVGAAKDAVISIV